MLLTELKDIAMIEVGTHIFDDIAQLSFDLTKFWIITKRQLFIYQKYKPRVKKQNIDIALGSHTFTTDIPEWISTVAPARPTDVSPFVMDQTVFPPYGDSSFVETPRRMLWKYEKPKLTVTENGLMDIVSVHNYNFTETGTIAGKDITEVDMPEISESDSSLINMVIAEFMISVGRSRRAFTFGDLPIQMDADQMISEGAELKSNAMESLTKNTSRWELGIGS